MPNKHFYFAIGAAHATLIVYMVRRCRRWLYKRYRFFRRLYRIDRDWFLYFPFFIALLGIVALTPDILHGTGIVPKEATRGDLYNIFFFHSYFEWLEDASDLANWIMNTIGSVFLLTLSLGILIFYVRLVRNIVEKGKKIKE